MKIFSAKSYAKINIGLNVCNKREDGYHSLDMVMVPISLHDSILFKELKAGRVNYVTMDDLDICVNTHNLATKAIDKLIEVKPFDNKFKIEIHKAIPTCAGFGGESSNAAVTMNAINKHLKLGISEEELIKIGRTLGADVPFFILNKPMRCRGVGEEMTPITIKNDYYVLIVKPKIGCSTRDVFTACGDRVLENANIEEIVRALESGNDDDLAKYIKNSLEAVSIPLVPEIQTIKDKLYEMGFKIVSMSGSGSGVYALSTSKKEIVKAAYKLENNKNYTVEIAKVLK